MYIIEIYWRINYLIIAFFFCWFSRIYYGEFILAFCREPWYNEWERDSRQYVNPQEIWSTYTKISFLLSIMLIYPIVGLHVMVYLFNSLTHKEVLRLVMYWLFSILSVFRTWVILIEYSMIGFLMDLSHFDEDTEIIYVPNLLTYINSWFSFRVSGLIVRQLPFIWIYRNTKRSDKYSLSKVIEERGLFIVTFVLPTLISALLLFDDIRLQLIWVVLLRMLYLGVLYIYNIYIEYDKI